MNSNSPKVSVILPVYNAQDFLEESVRSILDQTLIDFELLLINDGSTDDSTQIIKRFAKIDHRVVPIDIIPNKGLVNALNTGLKKAKGQYIARMDADDISLPDRLLHQFRYLESNLDVYLLGTWAYAIDEDGLQLRKIRVNMSRRNFHTRIVQGIAPIHPSIMFRNDGLVKYRAKAQYCEDYDMYLQLISQGKIIDTLPEYLLKYRFIPTSVSASKFALQKAIKEEIKKIYETKQITGVDNYENFDVEKLKKSVIANKDTERDTDFNNIKFLFLTNKTKEFKGKAKAFIKKYSNCASNEVTDIKECKKEIEAVRKLVLASFLPLKAQNMVRELKYQLLDKYRF